MERDANQKSPMVCMHVCTLVYANMLLLLVYTVNNMILCLDFNILHSKISSYKFLNSLKYLIF